MAVPRRTGGVQSRMQSSRTEGPSCPGHRRNCRLRLSYHPPRMRSADRLLLRPDILQESASFSAGLFRSNWLYLLSRGSATRWSLAFDFETASDMDRPSRPRGAAAVFGI